MIMTAMPLIMSAQAQIVTKDAKIEDFQEKTTKIVLTGNEFFDSALSEEIRTRWNISPYEFCTLEDFNSLKGSSDYYFLMCVKSRFKKEPEPGIQMLTLIKGGEKADKGLGKMLELVSIPLCSAKYPSGREMIFLPALIDIMQEQVIHVLSSSISAYSSLSEASGNIFDARDMSIVFSEDDLSDEVSEEMLSQYFHDGVFLSDESGADDIMLGNMENTLVSYTVAPFEPTAGSSFCYKMLIDAGTHELYYFKKHRITKKAGPGFLPEDLMRITAGRR